MEADQRDAAMAIAKKYDGEREDIARHRKEVEALLANIVVELQVSNETSKRLLAQVQRVINPAHVINDVGMEEIPL